MDSLKRAGLDAAAVYALFASVLAAQPDEAQAERMGLLLEAAGVEGCRAVVADEALVRRFHDRMVVAVSPLYVPAIESCMVDVREEGNGRLEPGHLDGKPMTEACACYRLYGFDPSALNGFPPLVATMRPDHLVAELAFMAHLRRVQAAKTARGRSAGAFADEFLERHLPIGATLCAFSRQRGRTSTRAVRGGPALNRDRRG
ncbi:MAG: hypothetical protein ACLSVD_11445 [Eggerthellaceae bacterium]